MVPKRNQEGPRKEIEVGIEWMRGERKKIQSKRRRKAAGSVREERKERYTYVVRLDGSVRHRRGALFKRLLIFPRFPFSSNVMNRDKRPSWTSRDLTIENDR